MSNWGYLYCPSWQRVYCSVCRSSRPGRARGCSRTELWASTKRKPMKVESGNDYAPFSLYRRVYFRNEQSTFSRLSRSAGVAAEKSAMSVSGNFSDLSSITIISAQRILAAVLLASAIGGCDALEAPGAVCRVANCLSRTSLLSNLYSESRVTGAAALVRAKLCFFRAAGMIPVSESNRHSGLPAQRIFQGVSQVHFPHVQGIPRRWQKPLGAARRP